MNKKKYFVNLLTLFRIPLTIINLFSINKLFKENSYWYGNVCISIALIIFTSDILDGKLARKFNVASRKGAYLDLFTDFFYEVSGFILLNKYGIIPYCFTIIVIYKLLEFILISFLVNKNESNVNSVFYYDLGGKIVSILYYVTQVFIVIIFILKINSFKKIVNQYCYLLIILSLITSIKKIYKISLQSKSIKLV